MPILNHGARCGETYFMVLTPTKPGRDILIARIIAPFATAMDAEDAIALLKRRYPGNTASVASSQYTVDYDADQLDRLYREARGDLAAELASIPMRKLQ